MPVLVTSFVIATFLVYLLKSPVVNHWNSFYSSNNIKPRASITLYNLIGRRRCIAIRRKTASTCLMASTFALI